MPAADRPATSTHTNRKHRWSVQASAPYQHLHARSCLHSLIQHHGHMHAVHASCCLSHRALPDHVTSPSVLASQTLQQLPMHQPLAPHSSELWPLVALQVQRLTALHCHLRTTKARCEIDAAAATAFRGCCSASAAAPRLLGALGCSRAVAGCINLCGAIHCTSSHRPGMHQALRVHAAAPPAAACAPSSTMLRALGHTALARTPAHTY
jgi:hypothetical protein